MTAMRDVYVPQERPQRNPLKLALLWWGLTMAGYLVGALLVVPFIFTRLGLIYTISYWMQDLNMSPAEFSMVYVWMRQITIGVFTGGI